VEETVRQALEAGVRAVQLRDKTASTGKLVEQALVLGDMCRQFGALFLVNDRVDVAMAAGSDGVHLGQDDMPLAYARKLLGPSAVIGISVRTCQEAEEAEKGGADYIAANMVFATETKTDLPEPLGLEMVTEIKGATSLPLVAIGGINEKNYREVMNAGADGVAMVSAIMAARDVGKFVKLLTTYSMRRLSYGE